MKFAVVSPRDRATGVLASDRSSVAFIGPAKSRARNISAEAYFDRFPDTAIVEVSESKEAVRELSQRRRLAQCLDGTLMLFDGVLSCAIRASLAQVLDREFNDGECRNYVLDILTAIPLPATADSNGAAKSVSAMSQVASVVNSILCHQSDVERIHNAWLRIRMQKPIRDIGADQVLSIFIRHGVFRRLALEANDRKQLDVLRPTLLLDKSLIQSLKKAPELLKLFFEEIATDLPAGVAPVDISRLPNQDDERQGAELRSIRHKSKHDAYQAALSQVDRIIDLYAINRDPQASRMLDELIAQNLGSSDGHSLAVKSLTNVAGKIAGLGRLEVASTCLSRAIEDHSIGIDSRLYFQIGATFQESKEYDNALKCYERAEEFSRGDSHELERIHHAKIRLRVAKGDFVGALSEYQEITDIQFRPMYLIGLGTLSRRMGNLDEARRCYQRCLTLKDKVDKAQAGLAEVQKQKGNFNRAISGYLSILKSEIPLETDVGAGVIEGSIPEGAEFVYRLALAGLYRMASQYGKAERTLFDLLKRSSTHPSVHFELGRLYSLQGQTDLATDYFRQARQVRSVQQTIVRELAGVAVARQPSDSDSCMPDEEGLEKCFAAYSAIGQKDLARARDLLSSTSPIDQPILAFSRVLDFHARQLQGEAINYKHDFYLSRIAKRGDRSLRESIQWISVGDFIRASELERLFMLRVA